MNLLEIHPRSVGRSSSRTHGQRQDAIRGRISFSAWRLSRMDWSSIRLVTTTSAPLVASFALTASLLPARRAVASSRNRAIPHGQVKARLQYALGDVRAHVTQANECYIHDGPRVATDHATFYCVVRGTKTQQKPRSSNRAYACGARLCSHVGFWHLTDNRGTQYFVRYWGNNGQK